MVDDSVLATLERDADDLKRQIDHVSSRLQELNEQYHSLRGTIQYYQSQEDGAPSVVKVEEIANLPIREALVLVAKRQGGIVTSAQARRLLVEAGTLKGTQIHSTLWGAFRDSKQFEQVKRGHYKLLDNKGQQSAMPSADEFDDDIPF